MASTHTPSHASYLTHNSQTHTDLKNWVLGLLSCHHDQLLSVFYRSPSSFSFPHPNHSFLRQGLAGLELMTNFMTQFSECWHYRCVPQCLAILSVMDSVKTMSLISIFFLSVSWGNLRHLAVELVVFLAHPFWCYFFSAEDWMQRLVYGRRVLHLWLIAPDLHWRILGKCSATEPCPQPSLDNLDKCSTT